MSVAMPPKDDEVAVKASKHINRAPQEPESLTRLTAVSPIDGRYGVLTTKLSPYMSELGLFRARVQVEVHWLRTLSECPGINAPTLDPKAAEFVTAIADDFSEADATRVKELEGKTRHDVKAVELFIKEKLQSPAASEFKDKFEGLLEFVHFGCTSEDVNNLAYSIMLRDAIFHVIRPRMVALTRLIGGLAVEYADVPMLSRTHGQAASPTTFGKEMANFASRLSSHVTRSIDQVEYMGKFNGAVGCFNAHMVAFPHVDWEDLSRQLIEKKLGLKYQEYSTQIECHDYIAELCDALSRFNCTLIDFNIDLWLYISRDLLKLKVVEGEVGSSTMPHKVNPIDFENSEGNLGMANALLKFFSSKLPISRLQRDLTDSTVLRNVGVALAHCLVAYGSAAKGLEKITVDVENMNTELEEHWEVLAEPIQTMLRKSGGVDDPYDCLKAATRGHKVTKEDMQNMLPNLNLTGEESETLKCLSPQKYTGLARKLAVGVAEKIQEMDAGSV